MKRPVAIPGEVFKKSVRRRLVLNASRMMHAQPQALASLDAQSIHMRTPIGPRTSILNVLKIVTSDFSGNTGCSVDGDRAKTVTKASARSHRWAVWCDASGRSVGRDESLARKADARDHPRMENPSATCMKRRLSKIWSSRPSRLRVIFALHGSQTTRHEAAKTRGRPERDGRRGRGRGYRAGAELKGEADCGITA